MLSFFVPDWQPLFRYSERSGRWILTNLPWPYFALHRYPAPLRPNGAVRFAKPRCQVLRASEIGAACKPGDKEQLALAARVFRLLARKVVVTQAVAPVEFPELQVLETKRSGAPGILGFGHHAVAWAREDADRLLAYEAHGDWLERGYRPVD